MRQQDKIDEYLFEYDHQFKKMMRAYYKARSYRKKLLEMPLSQEEQNKLHHIEERMDFNIGRMRRL